MSDTQEPRKDDLALDEPVLKDENQSPESLGKTEPGSNGSGNEERPASTEKPAQSPTDLAASKPEDGDEVDSPGEGGQDGPLPEAAAPKCRFNPRAWLQASRPTFFVATLVPLFLGYYAALGYRGVQGGTVKFALILIASFLVHLATNLANDLFDHSQGVDTDETIGGSRVIQEGRISPGQIKMAIGLCYLVAFVLAIIIVKTDWILWCLVLFAAFSSFFYVCPPIKYGHRGLGEVFVFINMGLIMTVGTYMAITGHFDLKLISLALPVSLGVAGILYFQSLPEIETDAKAGKKTLAVKLGKERAILAQSLWWPLIWVLMVNLYFSELVEWPALLCLVTFPLHWLVMRRLRKADDWLKLDKYGIIVRLMYLINGILLIGGLCSLSIGPKAQPTIPDRPAAAATSSKPVPAPAVEEAEEEPATPDPETLAGPTAAPQGSQAEQPAAPQEPQATPDQAEQPAAHQEAQPSPVQAEEPSPPQPSSDQAELPGVPPAPDDQAQPSPDQAGPEDQPSAGPGVPDAPPTATTVVPQTLPELADPPPPPAAPPLAPRTTKVPQALYLTTVLFASKETPC